MTIIAHPIGDFDEDILINNIQDVQEGWYFLTENNQLISTDFNPSIDEVYQDSNLIYVTGFTPLASGVPYRAVVQPSGVAIYWELPSDVNSPYIFTPVDDSDLYGEIVFVDIDSPIQKVTISLPLKEKVANGIQITFKERIIENKSTSIALKEKLISLLNVDVKLVAKDKMKLIWQGNPVEFIEILRKGFGENTYRETLALVPWSPQEYIIMIDNNSYSFTVRGLNGTGISLNEVSIGLRGETTMDALIDLGDYVKYFEINVPFVAVFEIEIGF